MVRHRVAAITAALMLPFALTGCLRTNADVQVGPDGDLGAAVVQVGIKKDIAEQAGIMNLAGFETYIKTNKKVLPGDNCVFNETEAEYTLDCHTPDVVDNTGAFTGITTTIEGGKLILTARPNALTEDLSSYDPSGQAVGSIVFYFDGDIESVSAPNSAVRTPGSNVVAFDLQNGKFFHDTAIVTVRPHSDAIYYYIGGGVLLLLIGGGIWWYARRQKAANPFVSSPEDEAPHSKEKKKTPTGSLRDPLAEKLAQTGEIPVIKTDENGNPIKP